MIIYSVTDNTKSLKTLKYLEKKGIRCNCLPITKLCYKKMPCTKIKFDFIVLTSSNSVFSFLKYIKIYKKKYQNIPKVFVIGSETGDVLKKKNFLSFIQADGNKHSLSEKIILNTKIFSRGIWLCGYHRTNDLILKLKHNKRLLKQWTTYEMVERNLKFDFSQIKKILKFENYFLVKSSRNVIILTNILNKHKIFDKINHDSTIVTISKHISKFAYEIGWRNVEIIDEASNEIFLDKFLKLFRKKLLNG